MAKDLVRSRMQVNMFYTMAGQLKAIENQLATAQINATMLDSLKGVNKVMGSVNANMNPQEMNKIMRDFAKETEKMNIQGEMMNDAMDAMGDGETENQADEVYNQILGEIGMSTNAEMVAGSGNIEANQQPISAAEQVSFLILVVIFSIHRTKRTTSNLDLMLLKDCELI